ncbi:MAG: argininosuccinate synthase [Methanoregulaceae archaeon]
MERNLTCEKETGERIVLPRGIVFCIICMLSLSMGACAATTSLNIVKYGDDGITILDETAVTYEWMEQNLPVQGDGSTHYYHQGPVFLDDPDPATQEMLRWNPPEDKNVQEKDMGALKGTDLRDLCELVGGMSPGDTVKIRSVDGFVKEFSYRNVYFPPPRQGPLVVTWWKADAGYVPDYREGMRLVFFADTGTNPWGIHAFGNWDWHESADQEYWYYYSQGDQKYPTTTGLSVQYISDILIYPGSPAQTEPPRTTTHATRAPTQAGFSLHVIMGALTVGVVLVFTTKKR